MNALGPILLALAAGAIFAVELAINAHLGDVVGGSIGAGLVSFLVGSVVLVLATAVFGSPAASVAAFGRTTWVMWLGGVLGAGLLVSLILLIPRLGAATTVGLQITGQMVMSVVMDQFGVLGVPVDPISPGELLGGAVTILGAGLIAYGTAVGGPPDGTATDGGVDRTGSLFVLGAGALVVGAVTPIQAAINAQLRAAIDGPLFSGAVSFVVGTAVLTAVVLVVSDARPSVRGLGDAPWWVWLGGFAAAFYVDSSLVLIPAIGAAATVGFAAAGQQLTSVAIDRYGLFRTVKRAATPSRVAGSVLLLAGVSLIEFL